VRGRLHELRPNGKNGKNDLDDQAVDPGAENPQERLDMQWHILYSCI